MNRWRITYILENKHNISSYYVSKDQNFPTFKRVFKELKGVLPLPSNYIDEFSLFESITIYWCSGNTHFASFSTILPNGFHMIVRPLGNIWKSSIPTWESFIDTEVGKVYYNHVISSDIFLLNINHMLNTYFYTQIENIENVDQVELFIYPQSKTFNFERDKSLKFLQNTSEEVKVDFLEPFPNSNGVKYILKKDIFSPKNISRSSTFFFNNFLNSTIYSEILSPMGFHAKIRSRIIVHELLENNCSLYVLYYLPKFVFVDKRFSNLKRIHFIRGETDLEAPSWKLKKWGSILLAEVVSNHVNNSFFVDLPIHLRYSSPEKQMFYTSHLPLPTSFFSCQLIQATTQTPLISNWKLLHQYFQKNSTFYFLHNSNYNDSFMTIHIPVVNSDHILLVQFISFLFIFISFVYISSKIILLNIQKFKYKRR
ncbi:hypothetical protein PORY_001923 [Pneumocystis oryctolagi]|uniref:Uncharacterized protein n=1 Tax=Pneumocystis oryctolagi TaxID=42067 RepID=A0ACB7CAW9_9ASCO|nr:hypothetical protein PORY_001923 [Pneumocystis oryctolagi]